MRMNPSFRPIIWWQFNIVRCEGSSDSTEPISQREVTLRTTRASSDDGATGKGSVKSVKCLCRLVRLTPGCPDKAILDVVRQKAMC